MPRTSPPRKDKNNVPRQKRELPAAPRKEAERIAKVVARAGLASRREIEDWIAQGRIAVNGEVLTTPAVTVTAQDVITVDGAPLPEKERTRLFLYHKPRGVVTTNRDPEGRTTLFEILPKGLPRLVSVGRLDLNSEGLLLLTNDGGLARVLELPETGWLRRYRVRANGEIDQARLDTLIKGISVDGVDYGPIEAELDRVQGANAWITVSLREGKNREVRNVLGALGLKVNRLIRISYGPFQLGDIPEASVEEVRTRVLREQIGAELSAAAGADFESPLVEREQESPPETAQRLATRMSQEYAERAERLASKVRAPKPPVQDEFRAAGPRVRQRIAEAGAVESRGTVADRKGRTVKVERLAPGAARADERPSRSGLRSGPRPGGKDFDRPGRSQRFEGDERPRRPSHGGGDGGRRFEGDLPQRGFRPRDGEGRDDFRLRADRPGRGSGPAGGGETRSPPRGEGFGARAEGDARGPRGFRPRESEGREDFRRRDDRPASGKPPGRGHGTAGEDRRPPRGEGFGGRPEGGERGPRGKSFGNKSFGDRPGANRGHGTAGDDRRPPRGEGFGGRPEGGERGPRGKSFGNKSFGNKSFGDRPGGNRGHGAGGEDRRPPRGEGFGDRPERKGPPQERGKAGFKGGPAGAGGRPGFGGRPSGGPKGGKPFGAGGGKGGFKGGSGGGRPSAPRGKR
ncbi:pseudouridine synthase [Xanthobacter sp. V4C-4]|uniref:pseudouridine synthase n=1 Tax=Xanthobacter cornucopiae TaxID=3119924 RepID=UPI003727E712